MGWFVFGLIFLVIFAVSVPVSRSLKKSGDSEDRSIGTGVRVVGIVLLFVGILFFFLSSFVVVPARNLGVVNTYGHVDGSLSSGPHMIAPWSSEENIDGTVQNMNLNADLGQWSNGNCTTVAVRLANQMTACLDLTLQWNIEEAHASELWQRYRGTNDNVVANIGANVVERELRRSLNDVFSSFNPLAAVAQAGANGTNVAASDTSSSALNVDALASKALAEMKQNVDPGITVDKLLVSLVHFDATTQAKLNGLAQAIADTQIAIQQKATAEQQKEANDLLAAASSNDSGVEFQNCLNLIASLAAKDQLKNLPVNTAVCAVGGGSPTPVIVNAGH